MDWATLDWEKIANAIVILVVGLAAGLGLRSGQGGGKGRTAALGGSIEIAGALVDSASVKALQSSVDTLVASIDHGVTENLNYRKSMERAVEDLVDNLEEVTKGIAALKEEIIRSKRI